MFGKKPKDPALDDDFGFDDDFGISELDDIDSDYSGMDGSSEPVDSESNRSPISKLKGIGRDLNQHRQALGSGMAKGLASRVAKQLPGVEKAAQEGYNITSDVQRLAYDVRKDLAPVLNQTKILTKQLAQRADTVLPEKMHKAIMKKLGSGDSEHDRLSPEEERAQMRDQQIAGELSKVAAVQMQDLYSERKRKAVEKILDDRVSSSRHTELAGIVGTIANQATYHTRFMQSSMTAYFTKSLELKFRHLHIVQDLVELTRVNAQNVEGALDAIRHNTSIPDSQKIHMMEITTRQMRENMMGGIGNQISNFTNNIRKNIYDNYITPALDVLGGANSGLEGLNMIMEMEESMGGSGKMNAKKTILGQGMGMLGKFLGGKAASNAMNKMPPEVLSVISNYGSMGKPGLVFLLDQLKEGRFEFKHSDKVASALSKLLGDLDRTSGTFENDVFQDPTAPGMMTKRFVHTVEAVIPGYLSMMTAHLAHIATGQPAERMAYDFKSQSFKTHSALRDDFMERAYGSKESQLAIAQGAADSIRGAIGHKSKDGGKTKSELAQMSKTFEKNSVEITKLFLNLANAKTPEIHVEEIQECIERKGDDTYEMSQYLKTATKGLKDPVGVLEILYSMITTTKVSGEGRPYTIVDQPVLTALRMSLVNYAVQIGDRHRQAMGSLIYDLNSVEAMGDMVSATEDGGFRVNEDHKFGINNLITKKAIGAGVKHGKYDATGKIEKVVDNSGFDSAVNMAKKVGKGAVDIGLQGLTKIGGEALTENLKTKFSDWKYKIQQHGVIGEVWEKMAGARQEVTKFLLKNLHEWLSDPANTYHELRDLIFDKKGNYRKKIDAVEVGRKLAANRRLYTICRKVVDSNKPETSSVVGWILYAILPEPLIRLGELEEDVVDAIINANDNRISEIMADRRWKKCTTKEDRLAFALQQANGGKTLNESFNLGDKARIVQELHRRGDKTQTYKTLLDAIKKDKKKTASSFKKSVKSKGKHGGHQAWTVIRNEVEPDVDIEVVAEGTPDISESAPTPSKGLSKAELEERIRGYNPDQKITKRMTKSQLMEILMGYEGGKPHMAAEGGTFINGNPVGTFNKPTPFAGGKGIMGEHGAETIVPHNKTTAAMEAYQQAKAFHEPEMFAEGGTAVGGRKLTKAQIEALLRKYDPSIKLDKRMNKTQLMALLMKYESPHNAFGPVDSFFSMDVQHKGPYKGFFGETKDKLITGADALKTKMKSAGAAVGKLPAQVSALYNKFKGISKDDVKGSITKVTNFLKSYKNFKNKAQIPEDDKFIIVFVMDIFTVSKFKAKEKPTFKNIPSDRLERASPPIKFLISVLMAIEDAVMWVAGKATDIFRGGADMLSNLGDTRVVKGAKKGFKWAGEKVGEGVDWAKDKLGQGIAFVTDTLKSIFYKDGMSMADIGRAQLEVLEAILDKLYDGLGPGEGGPREKKGKLKKWWEEKKKSGVKAAKKGWQLTKEIASSPFSAVRHALTNRICDVYLMPVDGRDVTDDDLLISREQFKAGVYYDREQKDKVKSVADIESPVFDHLGNPLVTVADLQAGLCDYTGNRIRTIGAAGGRIARHSVGAIVDLGVAAIKKSRIGKGIIAGVGGAASMIKAFVNPFPDVYRKDKLPPNEPLLTGRAIKDGAVTFVDGSPVRSSASIDRPVIWSNDKANGDIAGNYAITFDDLQIGLCDRHGKPLNTKMKQMGAWAGAMGRKLMGGMRAMIGGTFGVAGDAIGIVVNAIGEGIKAGLKKQNPYIDVYVNGDTSGKPRLYGVDIRNGVYATLDGKRLESAYGIETEIMDTKTSNILIKFEDLQAGLYGLKNGKRISLSKFSGRSLFGKIGSGLMGGIGWGAGKLGAGAKWVGKKAWTGMKKVGRGVGGMLGIGGKSESGAEGFMSGIGDNLEGRKRVSNASLEKIIGQRLDVIIRNTTPKRGVSGDRDDDGDRDGGYKDYMQRYRDRNKRRRDKKKGGLAKAAAAAATKGKAGGGDDGGGGILASILGAAGGQVVGSMAMKAIGGMGLKAAMMAGGLLLGKALLIAGGIAAIGYGGYKLYNYFSESANEKSLKDARYEAYGVNLKNDDFEDALEELEEEVLEIEDGEREDFTKEELQDIAENFGFFTTAWYSRSKAGPEYIAKAMEYFTSWYVHRFRPVFKAYIHAVRTHGGGEPGDSLDVDGMGDNQVGLAMHDFKKMADTITKEGDGARFKLGLLHFKTAYNRDFNKDKKNKDAEGKSDALKAGATEEERKQKVEEKKAEARRRARENKEGGSNFMGPMPPPSGGKSTSGESSGTSAPSGSSGASTAAVVPGMGSEGANIPPAPKDKPSTGANGSGSGSSAPSSGNFNVLGSYVKRFESGKKGSDCIAYDKAGGTSYGSFQIAAKTGAMTTFLNWCKTNAPEVHKRLFPILHLADSGGKTGVFPDAWRELVRAGKINPEMEHKYFKSRYYDVAMSQIKKKCAPGMLDLVNKSRALQEVVWSCAVQHGPGGCANIFNNHYKEGDNARDFIMRLYENRFTKQYFSKFIAGHPNVAMKSLNNRKKAELAIILKLLDQEQTGGDPEFAPDPATVAVGGGSGGGGVNPATSSPSATASNDGSTGGTSGSGSASGSGSSGAMPPPAPGSGTTSSPSTGGGSNISPGVAKAGETFVKGTGATDAASSVKRLKALGMKSTATTGGGGFTSVGKLNPNFLARFTDAAEAYTKDTGKKISITSAFRSYADQVRLKKEYPNDAAQPGTSRHETGIAIDIGNENGGGVKNKPYNSGTAADLFEPYANAVGLFRPYKARNKINEAQHFESRDGKNVTPPDRSASDIEEGNDKAGEAATSSTGAEVSMDGSAKPSEETAASTSSGTGGSVFSPTTDVTAKASANADAMKESVAKTEAAMAATSVSPSSDTSRTTTSTVSQTGSIGATPVSGDAHLAELKVISSLLGSIEGILRTNSGTATSSVSSNNPFSQSGPKASSPQSAAGKTHEGIDISRKTHVA